jgi:hypothetical protein
MRVAKTGIASKLPRAVGEEPIASRCSSSRAASRLTSPTSTRTTFPGFQLLVGAGLSAGRRIHDLYIPDGPLGGAHEWVASYLRAARIEGRVEGVVGISVPVRQHRFALAAQPFYVAAKGAVSAVACNACGEQLRVDALDAPWGVAFTLTWLASTPD